jgi:hypothetical protein
VTLQRLTPAHLNGLYGALLAAGGKDGRPLFARTVQAVHMTVRRALGDAARWGLLARNVAALASPPKPPTRRHANLDGGRAPGVPRALRFDARFTQAG